MLFTPFCLYLCESKKKYEDSLEKMKGSEDDDSKLCIICWEQPNNYSPIPCGHKMYC